MAERSAPKWRLPKTIAPSKGRLILGAGSFLLGAALFSFLILKRLKRDRLLALLYRSNRIDPERYARRAKPRLDQLPLALPDPKSESTGESPVSSPFRASTGWAIPFIELRLGLLALALIGAFEVVTLFGSPGPARDSGLAYVWLLVTIVASGIALSARWLESDAGSSRSAWYLTPAQSIRSLFFADEFSRIRAIAGLSGLAIGLLVIFAHSLKLAGQGPLVVGWILGQILWLASLLPWTRIRTWLVKPISARQRLGAARRMVEPGLVGLAIIASAWIRLWHADVLPLNFHGDDASTMLQAIDLLSGKYSDLWGYGWANIPILGYLPMALSVALFGAKFGGLSVVSGLLGVASLIGLYLLVRELWGFRPAIFALILGLADFALVHYSRTAPYIDPVPFVVWSLYFLILGLRRGQLWAFALSGITAAWTIQTYFSGRVFFPLALGVIALALVTSPRQLYSRRVGLIVALVSLVLSLGPSAVVFARSEAAFSERTRTVSIFEPGAWNHTADKYRLAPDDFTGIMAEQFRRSALAPWKYSDAATQFGFPRPSLGPIPGALYAIGLGIVLFGLLRPKDPRLLILLGWAMGYIVSAALTADPPSSTRMVGIALPCAAIAALGLDRALTLVGRALGELSRFLEKQRPSLAAVRLQRYFSPILLAVGLLVSSYVSLGNWNDYYAWGVDPRSALLRIHVARYLLAQPGFGPDERAGVRAKEARVITISRQFFWPDREFAFLLGGIAGQAVDPASLAQTTLPLPTDKNVYIIVSSDQKAIIPNLQSRYPIGRLVDISLPPMKDLVWALCTNPAPDDCAPAVNPAIRQ